MSIDYINELNESQRAAVVYNEGPSLVIAGAGSGKTRVLTYKIAYLLEQGYEPWNILALTFTNKAAKSMKERIAEKVGEQLANRLWMGTFHSVFSRILRAEATCLGFQSQFTIYDASDSKGLIRSIIKEMGLDDTVYKPGNVQARISNAKNRLVSPSDYARDGEVIENDRAAKRPALHQIYTHYWNRCRQAQAMDFDDLLFNTYILFRDFPEVLERYRTLFRYILVDEYQDTNYAQHTIISQLSKERQMLCVVGDDAQSIYSFRGANIDNILGFQKQYPRARLFKLEQNYRSTQTIVSAANSLIEKNREQIPKAVFSEKEQGEMIKVFQAYSDLEEAAVVVNKIVEMRRKDYGYADFAILYRTNAQSRSFEEALRKQDIPYRIYGGLSFYQRKEIKDIIAYFRLVVNPNDEEAFKRIVNVPARDLGPTTIERIISGAATHQVSLWQATIEAENYNIGINRGKLYRLEAFRNMIEEFRGMLTTKNACEIGDEIIRESGIMKLYADNTPENLSRVENIEELRNAVCAFCMERLEAGNPNVSLIDFLSEVSLLTDLDSDEEGNDRKVTLMTVHSAKGLEFPVVFVVGMEENLFPSGLGSSARELEEERRLFYVAITRAEKHCFLSYAKSRFRYGQMEFAAPSRFVKDIDAAYLDIPGIEDEVRGSFAKTTFSRKFEAPSRKVETPSRKVEVPPAVAPRQAVVGTRVMKAVDTLQASPASASSVSIAGLEVGKNIEHERFGIGEVVKIEGEGDNTKATIRFRNAGEKQLLLRFARFKVLD